MEREKLSGEEFRILMEGGTLPPLDKDDAPRADTEKAEDEKSSAPRRRVSVHVKEPAVQEPASVPVSYTHLDVYKRQHRKWAGRWISARSYWTATSKTSVPMRSR